LATLCAPLELAAQDEQQDAITSIDGENLPSDAATVYFNAVNCEDPSSTLFDLTLTNGAGVTQAFIWVGSGDNPGCQDEANRTSDTLRCRPLASNPKQVGDNTTVFDITLQELIDSEIADCENTALTGAVYQLYAFRNEDPGANNVPIEGYGVAPFRIDVTPPDQLSINDTSDQVGSTFNVGWANPSDSEQISLYELYSAPTDDPDDALANGPVASAGRNSRSISISANSPDLRYGDDGATYLYAAATDEASVDLVNGNMGALSAPTRGIAAETFGFCDDPDVNCDGCAVSPLVLAGGQPGVGLHVVGFLAAFVAARRRRR
jgi:hypothetical protein